MPFSFFVPEDAQLSDPNVLSQHLLEAASHARGTVDGVGFARLFEAAAQSLTQSAAEVKVQRGLAIAAQTLATELAMKCEQLQASGGFTPAAGERELSHPLSARPSAPPIGSIGLTSGTPASRPAVPSGLLQPPLMSPPADGAQGATHPIRHASP